MFNVNDIKNGMTISYEGNIYQVVEFQHVKPGKGSAFVKTKLKNLRTQTTQEITFNAGIKLEKANFVKCPMIKESPVSIYIVKETLMYLWIIILMIK